MKRLLSATRILVFTAAMVATFCTGRPSLAASSNYLDVCTTGCTYSSLQTAINAVTGSSATNVYTIFIDSGVLSSDTSISTGGKSYINFVGRGIEVSIVRASATWFNNVNAGSTASDFLDLSNSTNITMSNLTIDARTNDPGGLTGSSFFNGVRLGASPDKIVVDTSEILGTTYGLWEDSGNSANSIRVMNSRVVASDYGILVRATEWYIFSSDVECVDNGGQSGTTAACNAIQAGTSGLVNTTIWGSYIHGESSASNQSYDVTAVSTSMRGASTLNIIGSTLHVEMTTATIGSSTRNMDALKLANPTSSMADTVKLNVVGSDLVYQSPASLSQGRLAGIGCSPGISLSGTVEVRLAGDAFIDAGGTGGTFRADIVGGPTIVGSTRYEPTIMSVGSKISSAVTTNSNPLQTSSGGLYETINMQNGGVVFPSSNTVTVTLPTAMPDTNYRIALSPNAQETIYVSSKATASFTLKSSKTGSTASVDWIVTR